jgi:predicted Zn-dependent peptidase
MKIIRLFSFVIISFVVAHTAIAQPRTEKHTSAGYEYTTVSGDPIGARIYTLKNGLTVYLSVNKSEPRVQTMIAVRAGSKNDPADATGLAHYLEHLLFKGTDKFGSLDYAKEEPYLNEIENLYEVYRGTRDVAQRAAIYHQIDSVSGVAAKWAIANEYDKLVAELGAKGTNAFTSDEQTVYINDIPSNEIEKWLTIEGERYRHPVLRLFHTELEAVYEEKNRHLDDDESLGWEALMAALFQKHPYGQQTTIGTIEHLKNPSIKKIKEFYSKWYVPNNMAVVIAGDIDPDQVIKMVDAKMGGWIAKPLDQWNPPQEDPIASPQVRELYGPDAEFVWFAYRLPGINTHDAVVAEMADLVLANLSAGLIDLNLNQQQKVLRASTYLQRSNDYSAHVFMGNPKEGQSLDEVRDLLLSQIDLLKKGQFDEKTMSAIINDLTFQRLQQNEHNWGRTDEMMNAFIHHTDWANDVSHLDELAKVKKKDIIDFANKYYHNNYAIVYKRTGDRRDVVKVTKPPITPVEVNRTAQSDFLKQVSAMPAQAVTPHFLDYKKDIVETKLKKDIPLYYLHNDENQRFSLTYVVDMGKRHDKKLEYALEYLDFLGTDKMSAADVKRKFFALGSNFNVSVSGDEAHVSLNGLQKNFAASTELFETVLAHAKANDEALKEFVGRTIKAREDEKKSKDQILRVALRNYIAYGKTNPQTYDLTNAELQHLNSGELVDRIHNLTSYPHRVLYYGPASTADLTASLNKLHAVPVKWATPPEPVKFIHQDTKKNKVYFVNYDMAQAEVMMLSKGLDSYDPSKEPVIRMFNEYYGGSMASITFQTIRESKALAYAVWSRYQAPDKRDEPYNIVAYVGSQADKSPETMKSMFELLTDMPRADKLFEQSKTALLNDLASERTIRENVLWSYERARKLGLDHDIRRDIYATAPKIDFEQIEDFQKQNIRGHQYAIAVLGSKEKIDMKDLSKYGDVQELSLEEIFGY